MSINMTNHTISAPKKKKMAIAVRKSANNYIRILKVNLTKPNLSCLPFPNPAGGIPTNFPLLLFLPSAPKNHYRAAI